MYRIIPTRLELIILTTLPAPDGGSHLKSHAVLGASPSPLLNLSGIHTATSASRLIFSERRLAVVTDDKSPIIAAHTRKSIGVVPGRRMGLFRNTAPSLVKHQRCHCRTS
ncbi:hypothetical protein Zmor_023267 [Zophobas morio]|uniref:Uncharacterized protein n=1 Tax=Zophobas morio TaxID=2755281 RepID=A0AA38HZC8_9CUCU|nr:hypothetical protein Zmor_023267 [Zophobas morio]